MWNLQCTTHSYMDLHYNTMPLYTPELTTSCKRLWVEHMEKQEGLAGAISIADSISHLSVAPPVASYEARYMGLACITTYEARGMV